MGAAAAIGIGSQVVGSMMGNSAAKKTAAAQREAAERAAGMAEFKPYSITSGFGTSTFDKDKQTASYELDPRLAAYRDQAYGLSEQGMGNINLDTQQNAQDYYNSQQGLLAGGRGAEDIALRQQQLNSGRIGLGVSGAAMGAGAGTGYVNPEQYQRDLARGQVDAGMAANADTVARQQLDQDLNRYTSLFNVGTGVEQLGYNTMNTGADFGKAGAQAGAQAGSLLYGGMNDAAQSQLAGKLGQAKMVSSIGGTMGGMFGGGSSLGGPSGQMNSNVSAQGGNQKRGFLTGGW